MTIRLVVFHSLFFYILLYLIQKLFWIFIVYHTFTSFHEAWTLLKAYAGDISFPTTWILFLVHPQSNKKKSESKKQELRDPLQQLNNEWWKTSKFTHKFLMHLYINKNIHHKNVIPWICFQSICLGQNGYHGFYHFPWKLNCIKNFINHSS